MEDNQIAILQKVNLKKELTTEEMKAVLNETDTKLIYETANNIRHKEHGNACCVHGIIEFSNYCTNNCFYCGIRQVRNIERYRMTVEEILNLAKHASAELGFKAFVLQSGEDPWYDEEKLIEIVKGIKKLGVLVFLSIGLREKVLYKKLYDAGARAALLRFETANEALFEKLRPGTTLKDRLELIRYLKSLGYIIATGFIAGLPGETDEDIIDNILLTKELKPEMFSFGPLIPTKDTPLENQSLMTKEKMLKIIALSRFVEPDSNILVTTALETLDKHTKEEGLMAGANSLMLNLTPKDYRKLYSIYQNRAGTDDEIKDCISQTIKLLTSLGRAPTDIGL